MAKALLPVAAAAAVLLVLSVSPAAPHPAANSTSSAPAHAWVTTPDLSQRLSAQPDLSWSTGSGGQGESIRVDDGRTYQKVTGFGATLTDSSAYLLWDKLDPKYRTAVMRDLFDPTDKNGIALSVLRQPAGATDFIKDVNGFYTYDDLPAGQTDPSLNKFSIKHDEAYLIPAVRAAAQLDPSLKVVLTSWSPPTWMKTNDSVVEGGTLKPQYDDVYANYLVKAIQAYQAHGIPIWATSAQNEPSITSNHPSMTMSSAQEADFVGEHYAPALAAAGLQPLIFAGDDVCFAASYPAAVLTHNAASQEFGGVAMHGYCGDDGQLTTMHELAPYTDLYQTELSPGCAPQSPIDLVIGAMRNWAKTAITWNVALNPQGGPYFRPQPPKCTPLVTVGADGKPSYTLNYYQEGQASRFVAPGARRIDSTSAGPVSDVAFVNPDGEKVLVAHNSTGDSQKITVQWGNQSFPFTMPAGAAATFTWSGNQPGGQLGWGASTFGTDATNPYGGGLQTGDWKVDGRGSVDSTSLGSDWHSVYLGYADMENYTMTADLSGVTKGTTAPKYGIYACYRDPGNYVQGWLGAGSSGPVFVTHAQLDGMSDGYQNTVLPAGFDLSKPHKVTATRHGPVVTFQVDGIDVTRSVAPTSRCQVGLVTQDYTAQYRNISVVEPEQWRDQTGDWILANPKSASSTSMSAGRHAALRGEPGATNVTISATARPVQAGPQAQYGLIAGYRDAENYVSALLDPHRRVLTLVAVVRGRDVARQSASLPGDLNPKDNHALTVVKTGNRYVAIVDGVKRAALDATTGGALAGPATESSRVNFRNINVG